MKKCQCGHRYDDHYRIASSGRTICARVACSCRQFRKLTLAGRMARYLGLVEDER